MLQLLSNIWTEDHSIFKSCQKIEETTSTLPTKNAQKMSKKMSHANRDQLNKIEEKKKKKKKKLKNSKTKNTKKNPPKKYGFHFFATKKMLQLTIYIWVKIILTLEENNKLRKQLDTIGELLSVKYFLK